MLSIEITRECPLHCPGCYAYEDQHLGGTVTLRQLRDFRGDALISIRRGWRLAELRDLAERAGIPRAQVRLYWGARVLVQAQKGSTQR